MTHRLVDLVLGLGLLHCQRCRFKITPDDEDGRPSLAVAADLTLGEPFSLPDG